MKKRMFLSTILMTLVLLVALTTATFAWYQAEKGNASYAEKDIQNIVTSTDSISIGDVELSVELSDITEHVGPTSKELGKDRVIVTVNGVEREVNAFYTVEGKATWTVSAKQNGTTADAAALASIKGTYYLVLTSTNARITKDNTEGAAVALEDTATQVVIEIKISDAGELETTTGKIYFAVNSNVTNVDGSPVPSLSAVVQANNPAQ